MRVIKLYKIDTLSDGTQRFSTQLSPENVANFIMGGDGIMMFYDNGENGFDFYPYNRPYQIVENINDLKLQEL